MNKVLVLLLAILASISTNSNETDLLIFEEVKSIYDFSLSDTKMAEVFKYFDVPEKRLHAEKHELAEICFKGLESQSAFYAITGNLHDYNTLYGYRLVSNVKDSCFESTEFQLQKDAKIKLGMDSQSLIDVLGKPDTITSRSLSWELDMLIPYDTPIVRSWRAGPTDKKYTQVQTINGEFHKVFINAGFEGNSLSLFEVIDYSESDYIIKNVYD